MKNKLGNVKECKSMIKHGEVTVNQQVVTDPKYQVNFQDMIICQGELLKAQPFVYYLMNKPAGYICANKDKEAKCVIDLIDRDDCYCLGRLDLDTTGLLLITNDVTLSKRLLLPQNHVTKKYLVTTKNKINQADVEMFQAGIIIDQKVKCKSAKLEIIDDYHCYVTISEGKYHQIKKMFLSSHNEVVSLKRIAFGTLELDASLKPGQYRHLSELEIKQLFM